MYVLHFIFLEAISLISLRNLSFSAVILSRQWTVQMGTIVHTVLTVSPQRHSWCFTKRATPWEHVGVVLKEYFTYLALHSFNTVRLTMDSLKIDAAEREVSFFYSIISSSLWKPGAYLTHNAIWQIHILHIAYVFNLIYSILSNMMHCLQI